MSGDPGSTSGAGFEITAPIIDYGPPAPSAPPPSPPPAPPPPPPSPSRTWVDDARDQMISAGVPPAQAASTAQYMQNAGYSAEEVQRGMGETAALFSDRPKEEIAAQTGYSIEHIPDTYIKPANPSVPVDVARTVSYQDGRLVVPGQNEFFKQTPYEVTPRTSVSAPSTAPASALGPTTIAGPAPTPNPFRGIYNAPTPPAPPPPNIIKTPERFLSIFQEDISAQSLERLLFENIGGIELANIIRHDTVEGTNPYYKIISNLSRLKVQIDPITLIARQRSGLTPQDFGKQISLFTKLPSYINFRPPRPGFAPAPTIIVPFPTYLENPSILDYIFIDGNENSSTYGNLIVELINIAEDEFLEVEIASSGTIYEVEQ